MKKRKLIAYALLAGTVIYGISNFLDKDLRAVTAEKYGEIAASDDVERLDPNLKKLRKEIQRVEELGEKKDQKSEEQLKALAEESNALAYRANIILAERSKNSEEIENYYRRALELYDSRKTKKKLADHLVGQNRIVEAVDIYKNLLPDETALKSLKELPLSTEELGQILAEKKQWKTLIELIEEMTSEGEISLLLQQLYIRALSETGDYEAALPPLEALYQEGKIEGELLWWYGRILEKKDAKDRAMEIYKSLGSKGAYRLGLLLEEKGLELEAAQAYVSSDQSSSRWKGARLWEELGNEKKALEIYLKLAEESVSEQDDSAYRAYLLLQHDDGVKSKLRKQLEQDPVWLARLGEDIPWKELESIEYEEPLFLTKVKGYRKLEENDLATIELAIGEKQADINGKLALAEWYSDEGKYSQSIIWASRVLKEAPIKRAYELAYPKLYEEAVTVMAEKYGVDPYLLWAVIREESRFNADAVSWVGALGLMQIMPTTGKDIAARLKVDFHEDELLNPDTNINFGAYYLRQMLNMFSQDIDKALAAYNGGAGNVKRWSNSILGKKDGGFPTSITFPETREYITKVGNSYHIYQWLYRDR